MKKKGSRLVGILAAGAWALFPSNSARAEPELAKMEEPTLYEQVSQYLNIDGIGKEKYREEQYLYRDIKGKLHYNRLYWFDGERYVEQYNFTGVSIKNARGVEKHNIHTYPIMIIWRGQVYINPIGGVNGDDEKLLRNLESEEPVKELFVKPPSEDPEV